MRWLKLTLAYDGTDFCGWQVQSRGRSIQGVLEQAWCSVTGESTRAIASGRTDAGVHAFGQVVSLVTGSSLPAATLMRALNATLPTDVRVREVMDAAAGFHAIRAARRKHYRYLLQAGGVPDVFLRRYAWFMHRPVDIDRMNLAARCLVGEHDFCAYQTAGSPRKSTVRVMHHLNCQRHAGVMAELLQLDIMANGFLYNMARNIVGSLVQVGLGRRPPEWVGEVLASGRRDQGGATAPAHGLCLVSVHYD